MMVGEKLKQTWWAQDTCFEEFVSGRRHILWNLDISCVRSGWPVDKNGLYFPHILITVAGHFFRKDEMQFYLAF